MKAWSRRHSALGRSRTCCAESGIRWKVIVVSACFSGAFVEPLADDHTIVITAASKIPHLVRLFGPARPHLFRRSVLSRCAAGLHATARGLRSARSRKSAAVKRKKASGLRSRKAYFGPLMEERSFAPSSSRRRGNGTVPGRETGITSDDHRSIEVIPVSRPGRRSYGSSVAPISQRSHSRAAPRPSLMAQTTSD